MIIGIMGESGSGKTTSLRNLDPKTTVIVDSDKKGLSWKGWKNDFNDKAKNYVKTDFPQVALQALQKVDTEEKLKHVKVFVVDTLNGLMVADEMRRSKEKGYDKWQDLAAAVYDIIDTALVMRDDLTIIFIVHSQTDRDDSGYTFTHMKTSGKKSETLNWQSVSFH